MKKQMKRNVLFSLCVLSAGALLGACGKSPSKGEGADGERYIYYQKGTSLYRADVKDGAAPVLEEMITGLDREADELLSASSYKAFLSEDGQYTAVRVNEKTEDGTFSRIYAIKNQPEAKAELVADRVNWAQMDGNTLVFNRESVDIDSSEDAIWCYRPEEGAWQLSLRGAEYEPDLLKDDKILFSVYDWGDYFGNGGGSNLYSADISEKKNSKPQLLLDQATYYYDASDDLSKIYYIKTETEETEEIKEAEVTDTEKAEAAEDTQYGFYVLEDQKTEKRLYDYPDQAPLMGLDKEKGSFYYFLNPNEQKMKEGQEEVFELYYFNGESPELLSKKAGHAYGEYYELAPGLIRYTEKSAADGDAQIRAFVAKNGKTAQIGSGSYAAFGDSKEYSSMQLGELYDEEYDTYFAVCAAEKPEEFQTEFQLIQVSLSEDSLGETKIIDTSDTGIHISGIRGDRVYYYKQTLDSGYTENLELYCNGEKLAEHFKAYSLIDPWYLDRKDGGNDSIEAQSFYFMTLYPDRSYEYREEAYEDGAALWRIDENGAAEKLHEEVMNVEFRRGSTVLLTDYQNPQMEGKLSVYREGTLYPIDSGVTKFYFYDQKRAVSSCDFYLVKDEKKETEETENAWDAEGSGSNSWETEDGLSGLEDLFGGQYDDMTEEEIEKAKETGAFYIEDHVYHSPGDLYTLTLGTEKTWSVLDFSFGGAGAIYIRDEAALGNMAINLIQLEETIDVTKDASEYPDIEDKLTIYTENELISCENTTLGGTPALKVHFSDVEWGMSGYYKLYLVNDPENKTHCIGISYIEEDAEIEEDLMKVVESFQWTN